MKACSGAWILVVVLAACVSSPEGAPTRLGTIRFRDPSDVNCIAFSPDGAVLASGGGDGWIRFWDAGSGRELRGFRAHEEPIVGICISPEGNRIASAGREVVAVQEVSSGRSDVTFLVAGSDAWNLAFSPDGRYLAWTSSDDLFVARSDLRGTPVEMRHEALLGFVFAPDGRTIVTQGSSLRVWDPAKGTLIREFGAEDEEAISNFVYVQRRELAFSPDGRFLARGNGGKEVEIWDIAEGRRVRVLAQLPSVGLAVAWSPSGREVAALSMGGFLRVWGAETGEELLSSDGYQYGHTHGYRTGTLRFSSDGRFLAAATGGPTIRVWDLRSRRRVPAEEGHESFVRALAYSPDGRWLASGGGDGTVRVWDARSGRLRHTLRKHEAPVTALAFSSDGERLASGDDQGTLVLGEKTLRLDWDWTQLRFSPDDRILICGSRAGRLSFVDVESGTELAGADLDGEIEDLAILGDCVVVDDGRARHAFRWKTGERVALSSDEFRVLDARAAAIHPRYSWAFSPRGGWFASADWDPIVPAYTTTLRIVEVASGKTVRSWVESVTHNRFFALAASPDGRSVAVSRDDTSILLFDVRGSPSSRSVSDCVAALRGEDAVAAHEASARLIDLGDEAVTILQTEIQWREASPLPDLLGRLDDSSPEMRGHASEQLERIGEDGEPLMREWLKRNPSEEVRARIETLLESFLASIARSKESLFRERAIVILEAIGSPRARSALKWMAANSPGARERIHASESLERLGEE